MSVLEFKPSNSNEVAQDNKKGFLGNPPVTKNSPELFRLITGEEVVAVVASEDKEKVDLKNPLRIVVLPSQSGGNPQVGMLPLTNFSDDDVYSIDWTFVLFRAKPAKNLAAEYARAFSGIVTPVVPNLILPR